MNPRTLQLSPSKIEAYLSCHLKYYLQYVLKIKVEAEALNLVYGTLIHNTVEAYLRAFIAGVTGFDIVGHFEAAWRIREAQQGIRWNDGGKMTPAEVSQFAKHALLTFQTWWEQGEYEVVVDPQGEPVIERNIKLDLGDDVLLWTKMDLLLRHIATAMIRVFDLKTPQSASMEDFHLIAPQLTGYEVAANKAKNVLGIHGIDGSGFIELCKTKTKGKIVVAEEFRPRSPKLVREWLSLVRGVARDIREERFERQPGMSHSTPCGYCDFKGLCWKGDTEGLVFRNPFDQRVALEKAAA